MLLNLLFPRVLMCYVTTKTIFYSPVVYSSMPRGDCVSPDFCCGFDATRDIRYLLYTRASPTGAGILLPSQDDQNLTAVLDAAAVNKSLNTIVYVHGFLETAGIDTGETVESANTIRDAYLARGDYNVILVDWGNLSAFPWYVTAVRNSRLAGRHLALFLQRLELAGIPIGSIHLIGFSLGAEAAGFVGKLLRDAAGRPRLNRITGLDPAFPLYSFSDNTQKLHHTDAVFVDVIHTDAGIFGFPTNMGHADFYPNGGSHYQPGCGPSYFASRMPRLGVFVSCSHQRAWRYYAETVRSPEKFPATKCPRSTGFLPPCQATIDAYMGFKVNSTARGKFYLTTNQGPPYGRGLL